MTDRLRLSCTDVDDLAALYVLDALGAPEATEVAAHLADHPDRHPAYREMAGVTPFLAESVPPLAPPPDLKGRVMGAVAATPQLPATPAVPPAPVAARPIAPPPPGPVAVPATVPPPAPFTPPPVLPSPTSAEPYEAVRDWTPAVTPIASGAAAAAAVSADGSTASQADSGPGAPVSLDAARERTARRNPVWGLLAVAAVLAIVVLGGWNVLLQQQQSTSEGRLAVLSAAVAAAGRPGAEVAPLSGTDAAGGASGYAVFPPGATGYIVLTGLPAAGSGQAWQAWTIADGDAASAGLMDVGEDGIAVLAGVDPAPGTTVVALTLEPAGGSDQPTTTPIVVGELPAPLAGSPGVLALVR